MTVTAPASPAGMRRRSRRAEAAILESTLALLGEVGFSGLTMDGIAARAGVGKATIYRHWPSKAHVVVDAFRTHIPRLEAPDTGDLRDDLLAVMRHLAEGLSRSALSRILPSLVEAAEQDPDLRRLFAEFTTERRAVLRRILEQAASRGELRPDLDFEVAMDFLVGPIFTRRLITRKPLNRRFADQVVDLALPVLRKSPPVER